MTGHKRFADIHPVESFPCPMTISRTSLDWRQNIAAQHTISADCRNKKMPAAARRERRSGSLGGFRPGGPCQKKTGPLAGPSCGVAALNADDQWPAPASCITWAVKGLAKRMIMADNEDVDCQGLDHGQTDHHGGQDFAGGAGIAGNAFNGAFDGQTLADTGTERTETHADTCCDHAPCEKFHCLYSFSAVILRFVLFLYGIGLNSPRSGEC